MPTSTLYDSTRKTLATHLSAALDTQLDTLALVVVAITQSVSAQLGAIARAMPLTTTQDGKEQRVRRLLDNERITRHTHFHPVARHALSGLKGQRVNLLIDRVLLRDTHNVLVVSVGFRRRSIPLAWKVLEHRGCSSLADQQALLAEAAAVLPEGVRITVHADSEFRSYELFAWLRSCGYHAILGIRGNAHVSWSSKGESQTLEHSLPDRDSVAYLSEVSVTGEHHGPVQVLAWWDKNDDAKLIVYAVMTDLPATWQTYRIGSRRMWIETVFRDWQSSGFGLDKSGIVDAVRFERLLLPLVLAYVWLVSIGRWVVKRGYRKRIDAGSSTQWQYSLFQLGVGWKEHLGSFTRALPTLFSLYL